MGSVGQNELNSHLLTRIGEKKIFHELHVHDAYKEGIKRFWAQEAENESQQPLAPSNRREEQFFMKTTYLMSRK